MKKIFNYVMLFLFVMLGYVGSASAAIDLPETISVAPVETLTGVVLLALASIWIVRKLIKLINRS